VRGPTLTRGARLAVAALLVGAGLAGCFEDAEERALDAYRAGDYALARERANALAEAGQARGFELIALMAAQGLGGPLDFVGARQAADRAAAIDASYADLRMRLDARIETVRQEAARAFADGRYGRVRQLATALDKAGDADATRLLDSLYAGHYLRLPGSDMTWRTFRDLCSGATRLADERIDEARFTADCAGRHVVWDGTLVGRTGDGVTIRMDAGRPGARFDLAVALAQAPRAELIKPGRKVRVTATVAAPGDIRHPDRLTDGALSGEAYVTLAERGKRDARKVEKVVVACRKRLESLFRGTYAPDWVQELEARNEAGQAPPPYLFVLVAIDPESEQLHHQADGTWRGQVTGFASVQTARVATVTTSDFRAECVVDASGRSAEIKTVALSNQRTE